MQLDPIESRKWVFPFEVARLQPRGTDNYFDETDNRFIEYTGHDQRRDQQTRRINFWQYTPAKSEQPYLYFDTSRHPAAVRQRTQLLRRRSIRRPPLHLNPNCPARSRVQDAQRIGRRQFADPIRQSRTSSKSCTAASTTSGAKTRLRKCRRTTSSPNDPDDYLLFPDGPFTGDVADTIVNFSEDTTLEASQP